LLTTAAIALAGCGHAAKPVVAPSPVESPAAQSRTASADSAQLLGDARATSNSPSKDSSAVSSADVSKRAAEMFGDSARVSDSSASEPTWDIDVRSYESTERVEHYVRMFSGPAKERIAGKLEKGTRYEPMIRTKLREGGLPEDMYYLALIESGYDPHAYSRAAAVGMWQFMTSTARGMGMRVDWWVDERRDPVKSTGAAVRFLRGLQEQLGSLYLAAAAYNGGPGRIARGLSRFADDLEGTEGDDRFFALAEKKYLPSETKEYVPQLIAAALIAKEPKRYGMELKAQPPFEYDSVRVGPSIPLAAIAEASGVSVETVQELNPHILRGMTPPRDSIQVRIPTGKVAEFAAALAAIPAEQMVATRKVVSKKGEYASTIAEKYGLTVKQLQEFNPKLQRVKKTGRLVVGQAVLVPTKAVADAAFDVPDPAIERYSSGRRLHVVRRGETLGGIAKKYHTSVSSIMRLNGLRKSIIFPGQSLVVSGRPRPAARPRGATKSTSTESKGGEVTKAKKGAA
jgi:membrane-bound lytic murein transglycosylase D